MVEVVQQSVNCICGY